MTRSVRFGACVRAALGLAVAWTLVPLGGCATNARSVGGAPANAAPAGSTRSAAPLVLASPRDEHQAEAVATFLESPLLMGRLDGMMGAAPPFILDSDDTVVRVVDQQSTWNGRVFDSYTSTRWTSRRQRR